MSNKFDATQLKALVFSEFQKMLTALTAEYKISGQFCLPPRELFVEENNQVSDRFALTPDEILGKWQISITQIRQLSDDCPRPIPKKQNDIFYECGIGYFSFSPDRQMVCLGWQVGPRFGRGEQYKIENDKAWQNKLTKVASIWAS